MDRQYHDFHEDSLAFNETNDCTVIACAVAMDKPYAEVHALLKAAGRKNRCGFRSYIYHSVIRQQGFSVVKITSQIKSKTVRTIERELAANWGNARIMINVRAHVLAWDGRQIVDWSAGRQHRIQSVYLVYPEGHPPTPTSVPVPERKKITRDTKRTGVKVWCSQLGVQGQYYRSVPAAYKALRISMTGHQQVRKYVKQYGQWSTSTTAREPELDRWIWIELTIAVAEDAIK